VNVLNNILQYFQHMSSQSILPSINLPNYEENEEGTSKSDSSSSSFIDAEDSQLMSAEEIAKIHENWNNLEAKLNICVRHMKSVFFGQECRGRLCSKFHSKAMRKNVEKADIDIIAEISG
jgi:hypothetical protein